MKTFLKTTALMAALVFAPAAMAQDTGWYGDIGLGMLEFDDADTGFTTLQGHIGYDFTDHVGLEGELAVGLDDETVQSADFGVTPNVNVDLDLNHQAGVYGVLSTADINGFEFFGRLGFAVAEIEGSAGAVSVEADGEGFAYGVGGKYYFNDVNGVRLDVTSFEGDVTNITLGYTNKF